MNPRADKVTVSSGMADERNTPPAVKPRSASGKSKSKKKKNPLLEPMSGWGCLLRSVIFTLLLFAAYVFFGLLLEAMQ